MSRQSNVPPTIIKRKKVVVGGGHHGGAWKVAYADFVTAMMAFFLMLWLLGATTDEQRKGLADYFAPTYSIRNVSGGGDGMFGNEDMLHDNATPRPSREELGAGQSREAQPGEAEAFDRIMDRLEGLGGESTIISDALRHVLVRISDEGLIIEIFDLPDAPLFSEDDASPRPVTEVLVEILTEVLEMAANPVALEGHTRTYTVVQANDPRWSLSTARSERLRLMLEERGFDPQRVARVAGHADRRPAHPNPMAVRNNRLELILLRDPAAAARSRG